MMGSHSYPGVVERYGMSSQKVFRETAPPSSNPWISARQLQRESSISVKELRNIVLSPGRVRAKRLMTCSSPDLGGCIYPSASSSQSISPKSPFAKCDSSHTSIPDSACIAADRRAIAREFSSQIAAKHKSECPGHRRQRARDYDRDGAGSCTTVDFDENIVDENTENTWSGGISSAMMPLLPSGKVRKKKGKTNAHDNLFVEFEDREQRLRWERRWLKDDEVYLDERMKGMRQSSVHSRMQRKEMPRNALYQNALYFGPYSVELKELLKKKAEARRSQDFGALPDIEVDSHVVKGKKHQHDLEGISSLKSMTAALKDSLSQNDQTQSSLDGGSSPRVSMNSTFADFKSRYRRCSQRLSPGFLHKKTKTVESLAYHSSRSEGNIV